MTDDRQPRLRPDQIPQDLVDAVRKHRQVPPNVSDTELRQAIAKYAVAYNLPTQH